MRISRIVFIAVSLISLGAFASGNPWNSIVKTHKMSQVNERKFAVGTDLKEAYLTINAQCDLNSWTELRGYMPEEVIVFGAEETNEALIIKFLCFAKKQ